MKRNLKKKLPTKKEERDFVENLSPLQKQYSVVERPYWTPSGSWNKVCRDGFFRRLINNFKYRSGAFLIYFDK